MSFSEAATVFGDQLSITFFDQDHSADEDRFITMGISMKGNILIVSHSDYREIIRIISARKITKKERKYYEEKR